MDTGSIVLAGGKSLRLGHGKALETVGNKSLIRWVVAALRFFNSDIIMVTAAKQFLPRFINYPKLRMTTDAYPNKNPLGDIYTGLIVSDSFYNLVVGDMPFLNQALLDYMIQISASFDLVVPRLGNMVEPLHAVYSKGCLASYRMSA